MKKLIVTSILVIAFFFESKAQITYENGLPTGMTINNPSNSSNSYFTVDLKNNLSRAAGGMSIGLDNSLLERFWLYHIYKENNALVRKFHISYGTDKALTILHNGNIGIGTENPGIWKLAVNGNIRAKEVKVETGWSDFVFYENYKLPTLQEVEDHIKEKGHLKDIPSAKEVEKNGIFLGEMDAKLLQKIEELTLYTIEQEKKIKKLEQENQVLKALSDRLEKVEEVLKSKKKIEGLKNKRQ